MRKRRLLVVALTVFWISGCSAQSPDNAVASPTGSLLGGPGSVKQNPSTKGPTGTGTGTATATATATGTALSSPTPSATTLTGGQPRAYVETEAGTLELVPAGPENVQKQGAPSCYGQADDYMIRGDYEMRLKAKDGVSTTIQTLPSLDLTSRTTEPIGFTMLDLDGHQLFVFEPRFTDCHSIELFVYTIDQGRAYPLSFHVDASTTSSFGRFPWQPVSIKNHRLVIQGGQAAGMDGTTLYTFEPDWVAHTFQLVSETRSPGPRPQ